MRAEGVKNWEERRVRGVGRRDVVPNFVRHGGGYRAVTGVGGEKSLPSVFGFLFFSPAKVTRNPFEGQTSFFLFKKIFRALLNLYYKKDTDYF